MLSTTEILFISKAAFFIFVFGLIYYGTNKVLSENKRIATVISFAITTLVIFSLPSSFFKNIINNYQMFVIFAFILLVCFGLKSIIDFITKKSFKSLLIFIITTGLALILFASYFETNSLKELTFNSNSISFAIIALIIAIHCLVIFHAIIKSKDTEFQINILKLLVHGTIFFIIKNGTKVMIDRLDLSSRIILTLNNVIFYYQSITIICAIVFVLSILNLGKREKKTKEKYNDKKFKIVINNDR
jgi:hypothetical protein